MRNSIPSNFTKKLVMGKIGMIAAIIGAFGVLFGAFGAHGVKDKIDPTRYAAYRVGIEYLFFHIVPLLYLAQQANSKRVMTISYMFILGIVCFTGSNILMTTEAIHRINFHFLWPVTPLGGLLFVIAWLMLAYYFFSKKI
jgi:uncharacterized membrane protein YgdD (TMEM256/DUF423 family)